MIAPVTAATARDRRIFITSLGDAALTLAPVILIYVLSALFVGLSGDFPINDDWAYSTTTQVFVHTGVFAPSSWSAIPLIGEVLFATPFCMLSHCGFDDLRLATLLASAILFSATFALVRPSGRGAAVMTAVLVSFNPIAYALSFTFMSDMLFSALVVVGALLFIRSIERDSMLLWTLGTLVALAATMTRQLGLCLPLAYLAVCIVRVLQTRLWRSWLIPSLLPLVLCVAALMLLKHWLQSTGKLPALYDVKSTDLLNTLRSPVGALMRVGHNLSTVALYIGLFTLPLTVASRRAARGWPGLPRWTGWVPLAAAGSVTLLAAGDLLLLHRWMPSGGNILTPQGIGPLFLRDLEVLGLPNAPPLPTAFWQVVTLLALLGAFLMTERLASQMVDLVARVSRAQFQAVRLDELFAITATLAYVAPVLLIGFYDRYLLPMLPLVLFLLASGSGGIGVRRWQAVLATAMCCMIGVYAVLATHDYMAWNRARWLAITNLEKKGIGFANIDGGLEYNGLHAFRPDYARQPGKSWWWIDNDEYQITSGPIDGMTVVDRYPYETFLPPAERSIMVLTKMKRAGRDN